MAKLYKFRSLNNFEFVADILVNERLHCAHYKDLNDPFEGVFFSYVHGKPPGTNRLFDLVRPSKSIEDLAHFKEKSRVCSLSAAFGDVRLWSYYADAHRGIAIEIEFSENMNDLTPVQYVEQLPQHGTEEFGALGSDEVLSYKSHHWKHEDEFRVIQADEFYSVAGRITAVHLGANTPRNYCQTIASMAQGRFPVYQSSVNPAFISVIKGGGFEPN